MNHTEIKITPEQRKNLKTLANYLLSGNLKAEFDMNTYDESSAFFETSIENCGTIGCAIGHGPYAGIFKFKQERWDEYSERVFGSYCGDEIYSWCFSGAWTDTDNSASGAAKRILYMLQNGIPENHFLQIMGANPLIY